MGWWLEAMVHAAKGGASISAIQSLVELVVGAGADRRHPKIIKSLWVVENRTATEILRDAQEMQRHDQESAHESEHNGGCPILGVAARAADKIRSAIKTAVAM